MSQKNQGSKAAVIQNEKTGHSFNQASILVSGKTAIQKVKL